MAVLAADLKLFKTTNNLGGGIAIPVTEVTSSNVFDAFTGAETSSGGTYVEYACVYFENTSAETAFDCKIYVNSETSHAGVDAEIALGSSAINGTEQTIADKNTAPTGLSAFTDSDGEGAALSIGDIPAGQHKAVWLEISIADGTAALNDYTIQFGLSCDSGA